MSTKRSFFILGLSLITDDKRWQLFALYSLSNLSSTILWVFRLCACFISKSCQWDLGFTRSIQPCAL